MHRLLAASFLLLPACVKYQPPAPVEPREGTHVNASMGHTWDAVIDGFAARNIPIRTIERVSGIITTEELGVSSRDGPGWADCGKAGRVRYSPNRAIYNILVRGDSTSSIVRATVRWTHELPKFEGMLECTTSYAFERDLEEGVKERAERASRTVSARHYEPSIPPSHPDSSGARAGAQFAPPVGAPRGDSNAPPAPPSTVRTSAELLRSVSLRRAIEDAQRTNVISGFQEFRPDTLTVELEEGAFTSSSAEYNLSRVYLAYRGTTDYSAHGALELQHRSRRVGLYTQAGLRWER